MRKRFNVNVAKFMSLVADGSFRHVEFEDITPGFFLSDQTSLSDVGLDMLNFDFACMVEKAWRCLGWAMP